MPCFLGVVPHLLELLVGRVLHLGQPGLAPVERVLGGPRCIVQLVGSLVARVFEFRLQLAQRGLALVELALQFPLDLVSIGHR